ncbi:hypothetical protein [Picosynechococcus sp. NKBG15041c]|uniref:hypothetical protein n=1 Tax=Picosynechococcus sp. NKBG15041c TaxID=1407650 RepID=UPI000463D02C|nr:hypothetical protein [Picosynechococcus sp. NKBG15041c]
MVDRYVIQQTTRYYHALLQEKPFADQVDYTKPVGIIILSPGFHKDNYIDCLYHKLFFELIEFSIVNKASLEFKTQHLNGSKKFKNRAIPVAEVQENKFTIEPPSRALMNSLSKLQNYDIDLIIETRKRILSFNPSIKELKFSPSTFLFGKSKNNSCIDFTFSQERENHKFNIAFRLPLSFRDVSTGDKK